MCIVLCFIFLQVVTVWEYARKQLSIKQSLYGHTDAVTCLAVSPAYNVIVSGSRDATAIIWDLSRRIFVRQFQGHAAPVAAVAINELTVSFINARDALTFFGFKFICFIEFFLLYVLKFSTLICFGDRISLCL